MGQQPPPSASGTVRLASQHERLLLELLPFQDIRQFHDWLNGVYVRGSWNEFVRDFHAAHPLAPEPDKTAAVQKARDAIHARGAQYLMHNPDKDAWTAEDHHVRFLVAVVSDNMLNGLWSDRDWKKNGLAVCGAVFEVLVFLKATATASEDCADPAAADPPRYEA
ncbi:hypothetical protein CHGG_03909 [Chaetomium globosum CBS 148.51]|uniref:Uncharacterized protein n=1 Tax=Chaetomium globosum (strain ATCC 6205 / CBS 148.51 / DSM 1962 / NBRC 6347 / NRRL 1970) TaxID=306901 RepID=Q2H2T7_CHAGB|nr:uncharacterized protein CHGG_03909 [Chaetomium globosum CBS 148.51]EAQ87290.1 hypothetical protein CHGG_03909 [Chaetomium globosum CBS 148.51]